MNTPVTWLLMLSAVFALNANAKCINEQYEFHGNITGSDHRPVSGAVVQVSWSEIGASVTQEAVTITDADGSYHATINFYTWSSMGLTGDICDASLSAAKVQVSASGFVTVSSVVKIVGQNSEINRTLQQSK